ncbi:hypothetical protein [Escherichia coli]|nr:hypothetical protein [Escherichia coli]MDS1717784.1 hypothetical protein [Escherichia coli]
MNTTVDESHGQGCSLQPDTRHVLYGLNMQAEVIYQKWHAAVHASSW